MLFDVTAKVTRTILEELCTKSGPWIARVEEIGFDKKKTDNLKKMIEERRSELARV